MFLTVFVYYWLASSACDNSSNSFNSFDLLLENHSTITIPPLVGISTLTVCFLLTLTGFTLPF